MQSLTALFPTRWRGPATALALSASLFAALPASAATIFADNFDTGVTANAQNGASWRDPTTTVSVSKALGSSGCCSLQFLFAGVPSGQDDYAQATMNLPQRQSYWFQYKLYIPSNYYHRTDNPANNKFLAIYSYPYQTPGFQINLSTEPTGSGGSNLEIHYYNNGAEASPVPAASNFISSSDYGKWMSLVVNVAVPTSGANGVVKIWKNGTQITNVTNLASSGGASNYIDQVYFLGWSNSGFTNTTTLNIDDLVIADTPLATTGSGGSTPTSTPVPDPPSSVSVQ